VWWANERERERKTNEERREREGERERERESEREEEGEKQKQKWKETAERGQFGKATKNKENERRHPKKSQTIPYGAGGGRSGWWLDHICMYVCMLYIIYYTQLGSKSLTN
jgi:hypothetical protein